jgi:parallel beta-helix repeat protein
MNLINNHTMKKAYSYFALFIAIFLLMAQSLGAQKFVHPGIDMTEEDLAYMKKQVQSGAQPWKDAFDRMIEKIDLNSPVKPFAHVQRGPYARPNIGGGELSRNSDEAYDCALAWYITGKKEYASKTIEILNAWSSVLHDFDYNDAKLLAGWTGHVICNAAEILKYTDSGWQQKDIDSFKNLLMTVYYPLIRYYYPQANGNWDGAIINAIMAMAIFTDNREMYNNSVDHFLHSPVNGSIFKYIYPSGQCQETMRDQGHVQLGLGEFAGAARVAYTQGTDLFSIGNCRLALGYEYTASFLLGQYPQSYGTKSERAKRIGDIYEYVYRHYAAAGIDLKYTRIAADSVRSRSARNTLLAFRAPGFIKKVASKPVISTAGYPAGALAEVNVKAPSDAIFVDPGQSLQDALNNAAGKGKWVVARNGVHTFPSTLKIPSGVTLAGEGSGTVLLLDKASGMRDAVVNESPDMHDVTIRDLIIEGNPKLDRGSDPNGSRSYRSGENRGGIMFLAQAGTRLKNISIINVTVRNCTYNGVFINGTDGLNITGCDFDENGATVVPGPRLQHNLLVTYSSDVTVRDSRLDTSPNGSGVAINSCNNVKLTNNEVSRNGYYGIIISESNGVSVTGNLVEGNDRSGVMAEFLQKGSDNVNISKNIIWFNNGYGIEAYSSKVTASGNTMEGNGKGSEQQKISAEKYIVME